MDQSRPMKSVRAHRSWRTVRGGGRDAEVVAAVAGDRMDECDVERSGRKKKW